MCPLFCCSFHSGLRYQSVHRVTIHLGTHSLVLHQWPHLLREKAMKPTVLTILSTPVSWAPILTSPAPTSHQIIKDQDDPGVKRKKSSSKQLTQVYGNVAPHRKNLSLYMADTFNSLWNPYIVVLLKGWINTYQGLTAGPGTCHSLTKQWSSHQIMA